MFKFLKDKLKSAISIFSDKAEKEAKAEELQPGSEPKIEEQLEAKPAGKKTEHFQKELDVEKETGIAEEKTGQAQPAKIVEKNVETKRPQDKPAKKVEQETTLEKVYHEIKDEPKEEVIPVPSAQEEPVIIEETEVLRSKEPEVATKSGFFQKIKERFKKPEQVAVPKPEVKQPEAASKEEIRQLPAQQHEPITQEKITVEPAKEEPKEKIAPAQEQPAQKTGFFQRIKEKVQTVTISEKQFEEMFWELEVAMMENNVAVEVIEKIKEDLKARLVEKQLRRGAIEQTITESLTKSIKDLFIDFDKIDLIKLSQKKKPYVICFVGVNGSGKTTTIAKMAYMFQQHKMSVVLAAADTFRAAAIDQLQLHADKLGIKLIKQDYGSDAAAVAFDAIKHAEAKNKDIVLIDTAGRLHSNTNLMDEMKKVVRVAKPDMVIFVGESITGNDCVEQARLFSEAVQIDGIILSKADVDEKGGAAISISYVTHKPILYIGTGQEYADLKRFEPELVVESLGLTG